MSDSSIFPWGGGLYPPRTQRPVVYYATTANSERGNSAAPGSFKRYCDSLRDPLADDRWDPCDGISERDFNHERIRRRLIQDAEEEAAAMPIATKPAPVPPRVAPSAGPTIRLQGVALILDQWSTCPRPGFEPDGDDPAVWAYEKYASSGLRLAADIRLEILHFGRVIASTGVGSLRVGIHQNAINFDADVPLALVAGWTPLALCTAVAVSAGVIHDRIDRGYDQLRKVNLKTITAGELCSIALLALDNQPAMAGCWCRWVR